MGPAMKSMKTLVRRPGHRVLLNPKVRLLMEKLPFFRNRGGGVYRTRPFDQTYGVDTSSWLPKELIQTKDVTSDLINSSLAPSQASPEPPSQFYRMSRPTRTSTSAAVKVGP